MNEIAGSVYVLYFRHSAYDDWRSVGGKLDLLWTLQRALEHNSAATMLVCYRRENQTAMKEILDAASDDLRTAREALLWIADRARRALESEDPIKSSGE